MVRVTRLRTSVLAPMTKYRKDITKIFSKFGMYCPQDKSGIIGFIMGYECGISKPFISDDIKEHLIKTHMCKYDCLGWPGLIEQYCDKRSIDWVIGFKAVITEIYGDCR